MPKAVKHFADQGNASEIREIQQEIIKSYVYYFAKHAPATDIPKLTLIWDSIPNIRLKKIKNQQPLYYWRSKGGKAELDFLCEFAANICPLEVKTGINPKSKSLRSYDLQFKPDRLARANLLNLKYDGKILNLPIYAISLLPTLIGGPA